MKHLYTAGFVSETGPDEYAPNGISTALATRIAGGMTKNWYANPTVRTSSGC